MFRVVLPSRIVPINRAYADRSQTPIFGPNRNVSAELAPLPASPICLRQIGFTFSARGPFGPCPSV